MRAAAINLGTAGFGRLFAPGARFITHAGREYSIFTRSELLIRGAANLFGDFLDWVYGASTSTRDRAPYCPPLLPSR